MGSEDLPLVDVAGTVPEATVELESVRGRSSGAPTFMMRVSGAVRELLPERFLGELRPLEPEGDTRPVRRLVARPADQLPCHVHASVRPGRDERARRRGGRFDLLPRLKTRGSEL